MSSLVILSERFIGKNRRNHSTALFFMCTEMVSGSTAVKADSRSAAPTPSSNNHCDTPNMQPHKTQYNVN